MNYTYILKCSDGSLYTGWTNDLEKRLKAHNEGKGAKYTKARRPVTLVWYKEWDNEHDARSMEARMKRKTKKEKEALVTSFGKETE